jgi:hypothetical protein
LQQQLQPATKKKEGPMTKSTLTKDALCQFTGSEHWYRHPLARNTVTYTDGAQYVAEHAGAYWLLDIIAIAQRHEKAVSAEPFQVWKLTVDGKQSGTVTCEDTATAKRCTGKNSITRIFRFPKSRSILPTT